MTLSQRTIRLGEELRRCLAKIMLKMPMQNSLLSINKVEMSPCLKFAKVYVSDVMMDTTNDFEKTLNEQKKEIRMEIAKNMKIRSVPHLRFIIDESSKKADIISRLLNENKDK